MPKDTQTTDRTLPELPEGWRIVRLQECVSKGGWAWAATIHSFKAKKQINQVLGATPRAAVLAALERVKP